MNKKNFWKVIKPFLTNKGFIDGNEITIVDGDEIISEEKELVKIFNVHYINIVEKTCGLKPKILNQDNKTLTNSEKIENIKKQYESHPSIIDIKNNLTYYPKDNNVSFLTTPSEVKKLLKNLDTKKATGVDKIPLKLAKLSADALAIPLSLAINSSMKNDFFPNAPKIVSVSPVDKKTDNKNKVSNYRPVSVLNTFSKIYETIIKNHLVSEMKNHFSPFISAYRKNYSSQHVLIRLIEEWRSRLDNDYTVGGVLMDLSKAFDCIPHDLLIAKLLAYGVHEKIVHIFYSYLQSRKQCVKINNISSDFLDIISGVPQSSIAGPILFNVFINDFFYFIRNASVHNFADDNTITSFAKSVTNLIKILEDESKAAINWFSINHMIANPDKFKAIIFDKRNTDFSKTRLAVNGENLEIVTSVKLLGIQIDNQLNFNEHIKNICKSAANQLNALVRLRYFLGFEVRKVLVNSFILSNFNYCPLVWFVSSAKSWSKIESLQKRALRFVLNDYDSSYQELLTKCGKSTINLRNHRSVCIEMFKTLNDINPSFMKELFQLRITNRPVRENYLFNMFVHKTNQVKYGTKSLRNLAPKIWNSLPLQIKTAENLDIFKDLIKSWDGASCKCNICFKQ